MRRADKLLRAIFIPTFQNHVPFRPADGVGRDSAPKGQEGKELRALARVGFILVLLVSFAHIVFADSNNDGVILRPVIEYSSGDLRDPFSDLFQLAIEKEQKEKEEQSIQAPQEDINPQKPMPSLEKFKVQGVIWGGKFPQAIINNKILMVGDSIDGVEIVNIEKKGITLSFAGRMANLPTPGNAPVLEKGDNTPRL